MRNREMRNYTKPNSGNKSVSQRNRNSQIHPQQCQSTGNQYDSHGEPGIRKNKQTKFQNRKSSNKERNDRTKET